jgi:hypothetical protein
VTGRVLKEGLGGFEENVFEGGKAGVARDWLGEAGLNGKRRDR